MIIENPEAFKAWMAKILEPMCDADPEALAKYIYALVKKDKPTEDLRKSTVTQLEVFLNEETENFVDLMFKKLEQGFENEPLLVKIKEEPVEKDINAEGHVVSNVTNVSNVVSNEIPVSRIPMPVPPNPHPATEIKDHTSVQPPKEQVQEESPSQRNGFEPTASSYTKLLERDRPRQDRRSDSEREQVWRSGSRSPIPRGRSERSRSRSWEKRRSQDRSLRRSRSKSRRSRSRGRERDRSRPWRNRSNPRSRYDRDRKMRSWSKSPIRSRSRSPKPRSRYRNRSRSRSHSPYDSPGGTPTQDSNHGDDSLSRTTSLQSVVHSKKRRCRDFDEKGFCMRGEMCPFDHGKDPVVLEDVGQVLNFSGPRVPPQVEPARPPLAPPVMAMQPRLPHNMEYNPDAPSMEPRLWMKQPFRAAVGRGGTMQRGGMVRAPLGFIPHHQRELISVPVMEGQEGPRYYNPNPMKRQCPPDFSNEGELMHPSKRFDFNRLGPKGRAGNRSLQLKKVPAGLNTIAYLHNHFVKFGKIVNIQVSFEGDPEAALITFTSHAEASAAYKSTEAVLNNRFIKVFWYNPDKDLQNKQENISPLLRTSAKERLGAHVPTPRVAIQTQENQTTEKVLISGSNITKTVYIPGAVENHQANQTMQAMQTISNAKRMIVETTFANTNIQVKKKQEEKRKEALKLTQHLCKKKHELMEKLLLHQKQLIDKLEKGNIDPKQRTEILDAIAGFQENIDSIRKDIKAFVAKPVTVNNAVKVSPQLVKRTREEVGDTHSSPSSPQTSNTQKQILDAELDLFNQQQEGKDTTDLQKRVLDLKTKAHNLGLLANNGVLHLSRGGARFRPCRRGCYNPHATVDHRPTKLLVSGFESDDKVDVLQHFTKFGEVADHKWDEATPALVIQFKTRKDAETAMAKGRNFQDRLLSVTWFSSAQNMGMRSSRSVILLNDSSMSDLLSEHDDEEEALRINLDQNEDFLLQDEEEDEDEERSWRR